MNDAYSRLYRAVLAVLVECDPLELADPAMTLADEYEAEAREIARRALGAPADAGDHGALIQEVFVRQFGARISDGDVARIVQAVGRQLEPIRRTRAPEELQNDLAEFDIELEDPYAR